MKKHFSRSANLLVLVVVLSSAPRFLYGRPYIASSTIDAYLDGKGSALFGNGSQFFDQGLIYNVDPRLAVAIAGDETTFGSHTCAAFNAWNYFWGGTCASSPYNSYQEGIHNVTHRLRTSFLTRGYNTIESISMKYCKAGCDNWVKLVTQFYGTELGGDTGDLSFAGDAFILTHVGNTPLVDLDLALFQGITTLLTQSVALGPHSSTTVDMESLGLSAGSYDLSLHLTSTDVTATYDIQLSPDLAFRPFTGSNPSFVSDTEVDGTIFGFGFNLRTVTFVILKLLSM